MFIVQRSTSLVFVIDREFHEVSLDEIVDFSIHHAINITRLIVGTVVFHTAIIKHVRANLTTPLDFLLASLNLCLCFQALLHGTVVEL